MLHDRLAAEGGEYADAALYVVEPSRLTEEGFAVYENLLQGGLTASGEPMTKYDGRGLRAATQLHAVLVSAREHAAELLAGIDGAASPPAAPSSTPLLALGFSRGGIVLNQLLSEVAAIPSGRDGSSSTAVEGADDGADTAAAASLLTRLREVHYLDAGLPCRGAHLTDADTAAALGKRLVPPAVCVHGTPRQWRDPDRRWLALEKDRSNALLRAAGVPVPASPRRSAGLHQDSKLHKEKPGRTPPTSVLAPPPSSRS